MDIVNIIFNQIQDTDYVKKSSIFIDKELKNMILDINTKNLTDNDIDELIHAAASIGQYEGFKMGLKVMMDFLMEVQS